MYSKQKRKLIVQVRVIEMIGMKSRLGVKKSEGRWGFGGQIKDEAKGLDT